MLKSFMTFSILCLAATASAQGGPARIARCLHGDNESAEQKTRRDQAIKVAQAINTAEVVIVGPQKPKYRRPEELPNIPRLPPGFTLQFNTDGASYSFSVKDTLDACHYAIFSDQEKFVYEGTPLTGPRVLPLTTSR
jgi:hypothetical protein